MSSSFDIRYKILIGEYGYEIENAVAQELNTHGFNLYYYNSKKLGEVDFLLEYRGKVITSCGEIGKRL